ncbi:hypothetical protein H0901_07655 [Microcystis aeruginosa BLCCF158]|uniref:HTH Mu-type domain-containing protein n=1 Tax=Microcystis aeruginosa BLCC-F158 TaxID=2755316 RepID=A0A841V3A6_MICAE|nr:DNA-binding protein [Microcystis aeruginosa]MBC1195157.1 hypothetical protein [Microcystis aeruginosa BLCC-F158]
MLLCDYYGWPESIEGLRQKAKRENWPRRKRKGSQAYEYQAILPHHNQKD